MDPTLLQNLAGGAAGGALGGMIGALFAGALLIALLISIALYVYLALALMTIAKKLGYKDAWIAWIPIANLFLIPILAGKKWVWGFIFLIPIVNLVFYVMWTWVIYEKRGFPGALSLIPVAGFVPMLAGLAGIANLVVIGIVAWGSGKQFKTTPPAKPKKKK